jgi:hypothetical protein
MAKVGSNRPRVASRPVHHTNGGGGKGFRPPGDGEWGNGNGARKVKNSAHAGVKALHSGGLRRV